MAGIAEAIAQALPVKTIYEDLAQPAVRQVGQATEDVVKCLRLALAPIQLVAGVQDRYYAFLKRSVSKVPEDRRIAPPPQVLGPVIEAIRYEEDGSELEELASNLLASSMDRNGADLAHPSYVGIIRQLSRDEILIIKELAVKSHQSRIEYDLVKVASSEGDEFKFKNGRKISDTFPWSMLHYKDNENLYGEHLFSLGITQFINSGSTPIGDSNNIQIGVYEDRDFQLTYFGKHFAKACKL